MYTKILLSSSLINLFGYFSAISSLIRKMFQRQNTDKSVTYAFINLSPWQDNNIFPKPSTFSIFPWGLSHYSPRTWTQDFHTKKMREITTHLLTGNSGLYLNIFISFGYPISTSLSLTRSNPKNHTEKQKIMFERFTPNVPPQVICTLPECSPYRNHRTWSFQEQVTGWQKSCRKMK